MSAPQAPEAEQAPAELVDVITPSGGESVTEGTILEWAVKVGDPVEDGDTLVEISTDKVDMELPAPASGTVAEILVEDGATVTPGQVIARIAAGNGSVPSAPVAEPQAGGETVDIVTPTGGESVTEGTILEWAVKVGDAVEDGQTVVEISTDKVDMELPAPAAGTITEILAAEGDTVSVGQVIGRMQTGAGAPAAPAAAPSGNGAVTAPASDGRPGVTPEGVKATPVAARVAAAEGVDLATVQGTGPNGRITKDDVLNGERVEAAQGTRTQLKGGAAMLAKYMDESREIPTATSFRTITVTAMDHRRKQLKEAGQKVSFTHLIAYAIALAVQQEMPVMAHHFESEDGKSFRLDDDAVNLGIAVDVEKKDGSRTLMVPVIRDAGRLSFKDFKAAFDDLIVKARENKLTADDLTGANIQLTNPGGIGTIASVPRLMKGNGTIVATGAIAYPVGLGAIGDMIGAEKVMTMTSTYDHRIIQGAESGRFLQLVEGYLQGEKGFYDGVFASLGAQLGPAPQPPAPAAAAAAA
ncbi:MAG: 2-oxo acid dehydrogenase subunit E2, partial [Solirubrobacterales bacterium]|nr:2-oxo acid dehydrogenase subunit E2 [Solirubrobacterales bacterium]